MRGVLVAVALVAAGGAFAEETWTPLDGAAITTALSGRWLEYDGGGGQYFAADGATTYGPSLKEQNSSGSWRVEGDRYCSVWPPSDKWACYDMAVGADGKAVRFIADDGSTTDGAYAEAP